MPSDELLIAEIVVDAAENKPEVLLMRQDSMRCQREDGSQRAIRDAKPAYVEPAGKTNGEMNCTSNQMLLSFVPKAYDQVGF